MKTEKCALNQVEKDVFGTTDALVISNVLKTWNLPANVCEGVGFHQMPELAPPEHRVIAGLTQFAYAIAGISAHGCSGDGVEMELPSTYFGQQPKLKFSKQKVQEKLVREILDSLDGKESTKPKTSGSRNQGQGSKKTGNLRSVTVSDQTTPVKKGIFGWVKSLWNGN